MDCECDLVGVKRISGWQGKGTEAEGAWYFLLHLGFPSGQTLKPCSIWDIYKKALFQ